MITKLMESLSLILALLLAGGCNAQAQQHSVANEPGDLEFRTWTDSADKYQTEAAMIGFADGKVQLKRKDGGVVAVSVANLSRADQRYVRQQLARRAALQKNQRRTPYGTAAQEADWPGWRGRLRDGKSPDTGLLKEWPAEGPELLWKVDGIGNGFSSVAVTGGLVYITGDLDGRLILFAIDLDGKPQWKTDVDAAWTQSHPGSRSTPMIDNGNLYLVSGNGLIGCYDAKTGRVIWTRQRQEFRGDTPGWGYAESVLIYENLAIFTPGRDNCIVA